MGFNFLIDDNHETTANGYSVTCNGEFNNSFLFVSTLSEKYCTEERIYLAWYEESIVTELLLSVGDRGPCFLLKERCHWANVLESVTH